MGRTVIRIGFILVCGLFTFSVSATSIEGLPEWGNAAINLATGLALGSLAILAELRLRLVPMRILLGGLSGLLLGSAIGFVLLRFIAPEAGGTIAGISLSVIRPLTLVLLAYSGAAIGASKADHFNPAQIRSLFKEKAAEPMLLKILDTSVIIDGRIADVAETGFLDGTLIVPQFVLRELQYVADSSDPLKRNRGRKGLDILQSLKRNPNVRVMMNEIDFPTTREVDQKLIELALQIRGKILTNDFNLNKVAQIKGIAVLNINELANSLKPVILPGEAMKVFIVKEGKEHDQGVAYLDDGTMVVVNSAARKVGKTVSVIISSVVQTAAGKMFFGRCLSENDKPMARRPHRERDTGTQ
jgi:uncharacterized protein YacL